MAKAETPYTENAAAVAQPDRLTQLSGADVLNIVSKAAQHASRAATGNETRDAFIAFNRSLIEQLGGSEDQAIG